MRALLAVLLSAVLASLGRADVMIGDRREDVLRTLPKPTSVAKRGSREIVNFAGGGRIEFTDGKVSDIRGQLPATVATTPAAPAAGLPAAATAEAEPAPAKAASPAKAPAPATKTVAASGASKRKEPAPAATTAADENARQRDEALQRAGVKLQSGPTTAKLGQVAELKLPAGYQFIGPDSLDRFYQLTQNMRTGDELGVVIAPSWMLFFDYDDIGYVKDDEKGKLDADKLLKSMTEGQDAANAERKKRGWDEMKLKGWATPPHYDPKTNHLKWAINLASSQDGFKEVWINESIRLLGRSGVMKVTIAADTGVFKTAEQQTDQLLSQNFSYVAGQKYAEFKAGDKVAAYGLSALVLGGAGVMAAKAGLFAKLGVLLGKAWKAIAAVLIGIGAVAAKLLNKITRAKPEEPPAQA